MGFISWGHKESDTTERLTLSFSVASLFILPGLNSLWSGAVLLCPVSWLEPSPGTWAVTVAG